jgi:hypothetical protein
METACPDFNAHWTQRTGAAARLLATETLWTSIFMFVRSESASALVPRLDARRGLRAAYERLPADSAPGEYIRGPQQAALALSGVDVQGWGGK